MNKLLKWLDQWDADIAKASQKHADSKVHQVAFLDLVMHLQKLRAAVDAEDIERAVLWAAQFAHKAGVWENMIQMPNMGKMARSASGKNAVKTRHAKRWQPDKKEALRREYLEKRDQYEHETTLYKHLAELILKDKNKWRQIKTQIKNMNIPE